MFKLLRWLTGRRRYEIQKMGNGQYRVIDHDAISWKYVDLTNPYCRWPDSVRWYQDCLGSLEKCQAAVGQFVPETEFDYYLGAQYE